MAKLLLVLVVVGVAMAQDYSPTNYNAGDSGRSESVAPDGTVQGQYSYTDPNGKVITVKYRAGKDGFQVEGDHLPKAPLPQTPAGPQQPPHYNPNPHHYQPQQQHHQQPQSQQYHPSGYNPFHNPNVPAHLYQQAPTHPPAIAAAPTHPPAVPQHTNQAAKDYNPFYNPFVDAPTSKNFNPHTHGAQPQHHHFQPAAPTHPPTHAHPTHPPLPQHSAAVRAYDPLYNPHVPSHLYKQAPQNNYNHHQQPQPQQHYQQHHQQPSPFANFNHPNALPGASQYKSGGHGGQASVSQQNNGFTYNFQRN